MDISYAEYEPCVTVTRRRTELLMVTFERVRKPRNIFFLDRRRMLKGGEPPAALPLKGRTSQEVCFPSYGFPCEYGLTFPLYAILKAR